MEKNDLRSEMKRRLKAVADAGSLPIAIEPALDVIGIRPRTVFTYLPFGNELDTAQLNAHYLASGASVAAPIVRGQDMRFHRIATAEGPFVRGAFGIREPSPDAPIVFPPEERPNFEFPALALIPGLAFSPAGDRLGRGAGYYDRFLADILAFVAHRRGDLLLAGVCHDFQIVDRIPTEIHDIPVDCLLTDKKAILCI